MSKSAAQIEKAVDDLADAVEILVATGSPQEAHDALAKFRRKWAADDAAPDAPAKSSGPTTSDLATRLDDMGNQMGVLEQQIGQLQAAKTARPAPTPPAAAQPPADAGLATSSAP